MNTTIEITQKLQENLNMLNHIEEWCQQCMQNTLTVEPHSELCRKCFRNKDYQNTLSEMFQNIRIACQLIN